MYKNKNPKSHWTEPLICSIVPSDACRLWSKMLQMQCCGYVSRYDNAYAAIVVIIDVLWSLASYMRYHAQNVNWFSNFFYIKNNTYSFPKNKIVIENHIIVHERKCEKTQPNTLMAFTLFKFTLHNCRLQMQILIECKCCNRCLQPVDAYHNCFTQKRSFDDDLCLLYCLF